MDKLVIYKVKIRVYSVINLFSGAKIFKPDNSNNNHNLDNIINGLLKIYNQRFKQKVYLKILMFKLVKNNKIRKMMMIYFLSLDFTFVI
jgi:hypothetical protein